MTLRVKKLILSTSANPIHPGHLEILDDAVKTYNLPSMIEISKVHPDKGLISDEEIERRLKHPLLTGRETVITEAPTYTDKGFALSDRIKPWFVIGDDVFLNIVNPKYYASREGMFWALSSLYFLGTKFIIYPRYHYDINMSFVKYMTQDLDSETVDSLFAVRIGWNPNPISSTELRGKSE